MGPLFVCGSGVSTATAHDRIQLFEPIRPRTITGRMPCRATMFWNPRHRYARKCRTGRIHNMPDDTASVRDHDVDGRLSTGARRFDDGGEEDSAGEIPDVHLCSVSTL